MTGRRRNLLDQILVESASRFCIVDSRRRIRFFSPGMEEWTGWPAARIEGLSCDTLAAESQSPADLLAAVFNPAAAVWQGRLTVWRAILPAQKGEALQAQFCSVPLCSQSGQVERVLTIRLEESADIDVPVDSSLAQELHAEIAALRADFRQRRTWDSFVSADASMSHVRQLAEMLRHSDTNFTIHGADGTGRRHLAQCIHVGGPSSEAACVPVECNLLSSEALYNSLRDLHRMAGEHSHAPAHPGLLILVEVDRMPREVQQWLIAHIGDQGPLRLAGTCSVSLQETVRHGWMLPEFQQLIAPIEIALPPLHSRSGDVLLLAHGFVQRNKRLRQTHAIELSHDVTQELLRYQWPGNVRELEQVIHDACERCETDTIGVEDLPFSFRAGIEAQALSPTMPSTALSLDDLLRDTERRILTATLESCSNNKAEVARRLGLTRPSLYRRLRSLGLDSGTQAE